MPIATITNTQGHRIQYPGSGFAQAWDTAHDATTGGTPSHANSTGTSNITVGIRYSSYPSSNLYYIHRAFIDFDLSSIPANSTINSATLKLYGINAVAPHFSIAISEADIIVLKANFDTSIATGDYDSFLNDGSSASGWGTGDTTPYSSEITSWNDSDYNEITLNSTALTDIANAAGSGRFITCIMHHDGDYQDVGSGIVDGTNDWDQVGFNLLDDASNPPQLVVDYTEVPYSFAGGGGNFPAIYAKINGLSKVTNDFKVNGFKDVHVNGIAEPDEIVVSVAGTPTTYLDENFNDLADGTNYPTNWNGSTGLTIYGSTTSTNQWRANDRYTSSSTTGPYSHHGGADDSGVHGSAADAYMYTEASGGSNINRNHLLRTPVLDFSNSLANNTLKLTFWFHMGNIDLSGVDYMGELMVGVSDSATSAADGSVGTGFSGEADNSGTRTGMSIEFWDDASDDGSSTTTAIVIEERQQTSGHSTSTQAAYWRKATVNLNAVAGESSVYIWFYGRTGPSYASDICIDSIRVDGEE